ncbi:MAG: hypothetical protein IGS38_07425 [Synechococcales cyanobacterium M58_A2018_015]|nr:hypothetical protein [Synechococcales cyanobacterium M58_A2018_015]
MPRSYRTDKAIRGEADEENSIVPIDGSITAGGVYELHPACHQYPVG